MFFVFASTFIALKWTPPPPQDKKKLRKTYTYDYLDWLDINEMAFSSSNDGSWGTNKVKEAWGVEFPKGSGRMMNWSAGPWIAGIPEGETVDSDLRLTCYLWNGEYVPGPMANGTFIPDNADFRMYKLTKGVSGPGDTDWDHWKATGSNFSKFGCVGDYAPLITDPNDPLVTDFGYSVGDPYIMGDQCLWGVYNDGNSDMHTQGNGRTLPMDIEIKEMTFAFDKSGPLGKTVFTRFSLENKGSQSFHDMYFSLWTDCDQGDSFNDLCGCDPDKGMGYVYEGSTDAVYFDYGAAGGYDFFAGPVGRDGEVLPMTSFAHYINGTDPRGKFEGYNYMLGVNPKDGTPVINPVTGQVTSFLVTGDPVTSSGWLDVNPADRRLMLNSGPFDMAPGDKNEVVLAFIVGTGADRIAAISGLRYNDIFAQGAFDIGFEIPPDPPAPELTIVTTPDEIFISWEDEAESFDYSGYEFEGYNIYMTNNPLPTSDADWKRIRTFDKKNGIMIVMGISLDATTGLLLDSPIQFGKDSGLKRWVKLTLDEFTGGTTALTAEKEYCFAVTSYAYNPIGAPKALESPKKVTIVVPKQGLPGTDLTGVEPGTATEATHSAGAGIGEVFVNVVNPQLVTGQTYKVTFTTMVDGTVSWNLLAGNITKIEKNTNFSGSWDSPIVDGIILRVDGQKGAPDAWSSYKHTDESIASDTLTTMIVTADLDTFDVGHKRFEHAISLSLRGRAFYEWANDNEYLPHSVMGNDIEIRVKGEGNGQVATAINGGTGEWTVDQNYVTPFEIWDVEKDMQINFCWWDRNADGKIDAYTGSYDRLILVHTPYDANGTYSPGDDMATWYFSVYEDYRNLLVDPDNDDLNWTDGQVICLYFDNPLIAEDEFTFTTTIPKINDTELAKQRFKTDIRVVPNPYYGLSKYELSRFVRIIKFINLPKKCTIRIFDLTGVIIRKMEKDDNSSTYAWDIHTDYDLPVGSGVYIYHVESPGLGSVIGKLVVFTERETLETY